MAAHPGRKHILILVAAAALLAAAVAALLAVRASDEASCRSFSAPGTEVWLVLGQSNAANHAEARTEAGPAVAAFDGRRCIAARDPLPGGTGTGGSLWPTLGDAWVSRGAAGRVIVAMVAQESTPVSRWQPGGRLHRRTMRTIDALGRRGLAVDRILWIQGEADAILGTGGEEYARALESALAPLHRASGAPVWIALASRCGD
ncbi:MAG TPA: sialate O-acetylesterase, partial [Allosphingosinicella sp.]